MGRDGRSWAYFIRRYFQHLYRQMRTLAMETYVKRKAFLFHECLIHFRQLSLQHHEQNVHVPPTHTNIFLTLKWFVIVPGLEKYLNVSHAFFFLLKNFHSNGIPDIGDKCSFKLSMFFQIESIVKFIWEKYLNMPNILYVFRVVW